MAAVRPPFDGAAVDVPATVTPDRVGAQPSAGVTRPDTALGTNEWCRLDPPKPGDPYVARSCRGKHWGGFRNNQMFTDCLFTLGDGERWIARGGRWEQW